MYNRVKYSKLIDRVNRWICNYLYGSSGDDHFRKSEYIYWGNLWTANANLFKSKLIKLIEELNLSQNEMLDIISITCNHDHHHNLKYSRNSHTEIIIKIFSMSRAEIMIMEIIE